MARKQHTYHYIYKTTCKVNSKFYIGMHSTSNLEDGYIGSGKRLWNSIRKHGKENHSIEILEWFLDRSSLKERERVLVNEDLIKEDLCMNLKTGGEGGWSKESVTKGALKMLSIVWKDEKFISKQRERRIATNTENWKLPEYREKMLSAINWKGKSHTKETRKLIGEKNSISQRGEKNSQYGKMWITNGIENKTVIKNEIIPDGWKKGRKL